ncbi:MAG: NADH-quinone oxidoreductase subunit D [SAR324 cluster bacterium]|nr:NADH-quinone oxidoreductase subunit D [SAR324 cluster bacterium]
MTVHISTLNDRTTVPENSKSSLNTQEFFINMGPQHPSTHGVLRLVLKMDGETIREVIPVLGYIHRSIEKICEHNTYRQIVHLTDRMDYLSAVMNNWAVSMAVEKAAQIELTDRIEYIRTILAEMQRLQSHQLWWGVTGMDLGAFTPFLYGFRDREMLTDIFEETMGARLTLNYIQPAGLMFDIHPDFVKKTKDYLKYFKPKLEEYEALLSANPIFQQRLRDVGILDREKAVSLGATGPVLRACGIPYDLRRVEPYGVYEKVSFKIAVGSVGDCWDRYSVRMEEMRQSIQIIEQLIDNIPEGKFITKKPAAKITIPEGRYYSQMETARGVLGVLIVSTGKEKPYRFHLRSPNFNNLWTITQMAPGSRLGDLVAMVSTLDLVIPDMDR